MPRAAAVAVLALLVTGCLGAEPLAVTSVPGAAALLCPDGAAPPACEAALSGPGPVEFSAAVNPLDPLNAVVVGNDYGAPSRASATAPVSPHPLWISWWTTKDGGATWTEGTLEGMAPDARSPLFGYHFTGDPVVAFAGDGTAWLAGIAYTRVADAAFLYRNAIFVARSDDGGLTFEDPVLVDARVADMIFHDKPALAVDADGRLYLAWILADRLGQREGADEAWGMRWAVSEDGGRTWALAWLSEGDYGISASIAIGPDGAVNVAWRAYEPYAVRFARSTDHGKTFGPTTTLRELTEMDLTLPKTTYRAFVLPTLVALPDGTLLGVTADAGEAGDSDVFLLRSTDDGASWTARRLNEDATTNAQFLPTLATDGEGRVVAAWLDRREGDDEAYRLYAVASEDGAEFTEFPVAAEASPDPNAPRGDARDAFRGATFVGDYIGAAGNDGRFYLAWPDLRDGGRARLFAAPLGFAG